MTFMSIVLSIVLTIIIYLSVPLLLVKTGKPMSRLKMNLISLFNLMIGIFISSALVYILSSGSKIATVGGSLLWTIVGNVLMKKHLALEADPVDIRFEEKKRKQKEKVDLDIKNGKYASEAEMNKRQGIIGLCIIASVFIVFISIVCIWGGK